MIKKLKKWMCMLLVISVALGMNSTSIASEKAGSRQVNSIIQIKAVDLLKKGYDEFYEFNNSSAELCCYCEKDGIIEIYFLLEVEATLKAKSVDELAYYQGIKEFFDSKEETLILARNKSINYVEYKALVSKKMKVIYNDLEQYINKAQVIPFYVKAIYKENDVENASIFFDNGFEYVDAEQLYPNGEAELKKNGYRYMEYENKEILESLRRPETKARAATQNYSVLNAVRYSNSYSSNPTTCNIHGSTCGQLVDTSKYNSNYTNYASTHSDCANFVSQIAKAGGIPTDTTWKPGNVQWTSVSKLCDYMVTNNYWEEISYSELAVGDFVVFSPQSHIAFISANDGQQFRYTAHTNDRLNYPLTNKSTYKYYRVVY